MSGVDVEGVLAAHMIGHERRAYPSYVCFCGWDGAQGDDGSETDGQNDTADAARAHVAAVLREQIAAAQAEAWDEGYTAGQHTDVAAETQAPNPYRAALIAPSRVPGEET